MGINRKYRSLEPYIAGYVRDRLKGDFKMKTKLIGLMGIIAFFALSITACDEGSMSSISTRPPKSAAEAMEIARQAAGRVTEKPVKKGVGETVKGFFDINKDGVVGLNEAGQRIAEIVLGGVLPVACKNDVDPPLKATITVPAITTVSNPMNFGAVSSYTGWDANFPASDVTYTLTLSQSGTTKASVGPTSAAASISATGQSSGIYTITQTFFYKGNPITGGSRSVAVMITGGGAFDTGTGMAVSENDYTPTNLKSLTLNLSKAR